MDAPRLPPTDAMMASFRAAVYWVFDGDQRITLRIDQANPAMAALLARRGVDRGGLVTGWNPFAQSLTRAENDAANARLRARIEARGLAWLPADGGAENGSWSEPGFLVLGADDAVMEALSREFRQAAWVRIDRAGLPTLGVCCYPKASSGESPCWPPSVYPADG